jgi:hypothetical protein
MDPDPNALFHDLLVKTLQKYNSYLQATMEDHSTEHKHP